MKTIIKSISVLVLGTLLFASCEKFLDTVSYTENNTSNFPASETDALQMITGIYNVLNGGIYEPASSYFMTAMAASDECFGGGGVDDYDIQSYDHFMYAGLDSQLSFWQEYYNGITRANMAIANLDRSRTKTCATSFWARRTSCVPTCCSN